LHVSVQSPAKTIFLRPVALIAATKFWSSHAFMDDRSIGVCFGNTRVELRPHDSAEALRFYRAEDDGHIEHREAFASATVWLMIDSRSG